MDRKLDEGSSKLLLRRAFAALVFQSDGAILKVIEISKCKNNLCTSLDDVTTNRMAPSIVPDW
jgi:hypothetical protein